MKTALLNNRYRIIETLGRGGFGQTFLAVDTHMPSGRKCVIKQLQPSVQDSKMQQWVQASFQREAAILEELGEGHAQIPRLYAYFSEAGVFYLVQEWIEGVTLQERAQQKVKLAESEVRAILVSILPVLDYVHSRRIVHRDIKPDNVILRSSDRKPVLIDFGAVKEAIATVIDHQGHTAFSVAVGTPGYMPSEQAAGRPLYSSDLYSLGLTAIYLLTGKSPQQLEIDSRTGEFRWRLEAPQLHSQLATVIDKAIRFHPRDRFASAREMLDALRHQNVSVPTQAVSPRYSSIKAAPPQQPTRTPPRSSTASNRPTQVQTAYVAPSRRRKNNWFPGIILLLLAGIGGIAFAVGFNLFSSGERSQPVASPELVEPELIEPDSPPQAVPSEPKPKAPQRSRSELSPERRPEIFVPEDEPAAVEPPVEEPSPPPQPQASRTAIPTFPTGTSDTQVVAAIGEPTVKSQGYWQDSSAWLYRDVAPDVDLGFLFDTNTGRLRQKEVTLPPSANLDDMQNVLSQLLGGNVPEVAQQGLRRIYNRQNDLRSFEVGDLEGMIQRNQQDRIYIAVWEKDFH